MQCFAQQGTAVRLNSGWHPCCCAEKGVGKECVWHGRAKGKRPAESHRLSIDANTTSNSKPSLRSARPALRASSSPFSVSGTSAEMACSNGVLSFDARTNMNPAFCCNEATTPAAFHSTPSTLLLLSNAFCTRRRHGAWPPLRRTRAPALRIVLLQL